MSTAYEPFKGYTRWDSLKVAGDTGKQKKSSNTGYYQSLTDGKTYYIKKSKNFPADDIAEIATSRLLGLVIGDQAVEYKTLPSTNGEVYIASEVSRDFTILKDRVELLPKRLQPSGPILGADLITDSNKKAIDKMFSGEQRQKMAKVLAGCLWVKEPDCQFGNILLGKGTVRKFDNGWGLVDVCKPENARVNLFAKQAYISLKSWGTHGHIGIPTNHFNDYPYIVHSQDFVDALDEIVVGATSDNINIEVDSIIQDIKDGYKNSTNPNSQKALELFAKHIGLDLAQRKNNQEIETYIKFNLKKRLRERADSIAVLQCLLKIDLALKKKGVEATPDELQKLVAELQAVIRDRFTKEKGYDPNLPIRNIIPPFQPPRDELIKKLMKLGEGHLDDNTIQVCKLLSNAGKDKPIRLLTSHVPNSELNYLQQIHKKQPSSGKKSDSKLEREPLLPKKR